VRVFLRTGVAALACAALVAGCGGDDDSGSTQTTPDNVRNAIFERVFSECGSQTIQQLAGKHNVAPNSAAVSTAVARFWTEQFGGFEDAVREAKLGCLQSIALDAPPGQTKKKGKKQPQQQPPTVTVQP
jgi:ABC-type phosphate transport system substrate-binding protein